MHVKNSLSIKYALSVSLIIIATAVTLSITFNARYVALFEQDLVDKGQLLVKTFSDHSEFGMVFHNSQQLNAIAASLLTQPDVVYALITDKNHRVLIYQGPERWRDLIPLNTTALDGNNSEPVALPITNPTTGERMYHFSSHIYSETFTTDKPELTLLSDPATRGTIRTVIGQAHLGVSPKSKQAEVRQARRNVVRTTLVIVMVGVVTAVFLSMYVTRPIKNLVTATCEIAGGNLGFSLRARSSDEIGELAKSFNTMTQALQRTTVSRDYVDNVLKAMNDVLIVVNADGVVERANIAACKCLGLKNSDLVGREFHSFVRLVNDEPYEIRQLIEESPLVNVERIYKTAGGREVPVLFSSSMMAASEGHTRQIVTVAQDITKLKLIESDLRRAKNSAEKANAEKSEFLANMSHELRTPLHSVLSFAELGMEKLTTAAQEKIYDYFSEIEHSGRILLELLNSLLDLAKLESGKMPFEFVETDVYDLISAVRGEFSLLCAERGIVVEAPAAAQACLCVADRDKIKQVLRNVLANAIRFSPDQGTIRIESTDIGGSVRVSVSDDGVGVPSAELDDIFHKFAQSSKTKTGAGGTGLGLAICREIIAKHNGRIWAENRDPCGAVFHFEIPTAIVMFSDSETQILRIDKGSVTKLM